MPQSLLSSLIKALTKFQLRPHLRAKAKQTHWSTRLFACNISHSEQKITSNIATVVSTLELYMHRNRPRVLIKSVRRIAESQTCSICIILLSSVLC